MVAYFLRRRGVPLVLSCIPDEDFSISSPFPRAEIIASGLLSEMESLDAVRAMQNDAYLKLLRWLQEKRYIPRLLCSAVVFIVLYLFLSIAIPDPVPIIDEILFSFLGAAFLWIILSRHDEKSSMMKKMFECVDDSICNASVIVSEGIKTIEDYYDNLLSFSPLETATMIAQHSLPPLSVNEEWIENFRISLLRHLKAADSKIEHTLKRIREDKNREKCVTFLIHQVTIGNLDIPDLALFLALSSR